MKRPLLSIVLPCYNEAENISLCLKEYSKALREAAFESFELILVDNNSKDNTQEVLREELKKYSFARTVFQERPGYGAAIGKGLREARGEFIGWSHADMQTPPKDTLRALQLIQKEKDPKKVYAKGKRYGRPLADKVINTLGMSIFETLVLRKGLYDINAEPNVFHHSLLQKLGDLPEDFAFNLYIYYMAKKKSYKVLRFPVYFGERLHGESSWNTGWKSRIKFIKRTIKFTFELKKRL